MQSNVANPEQPISGAAASSGSRDSASNARGVIDAKHEGHRRYTLIGKDDREFLQTAEELLEGTKLLTNRDLMVANLTAVFKKVITWCAGQSPSLSAAFISLRPGKASLFFVTASPRYDLKLDEAMTELEVGLGGSAGIGSVESFQIPERSIDQFIGADALELWKRTF